MIKKFCDKCGVELKSSSDYRVEGKIGFNRDRFNIAIKMELGTDQHVCRGCQIDAIKALDWRPSPVPKPDDGINIEDMLNSFDPVEEKIEGYQPKKTSNPPIYVPKKRPPVKP